MPLGEVNRQPHDVTATRLTRELYGGYGRNYTQTGIYAGQSDYYDGPDRSVLYADDVDHVDGRWYLSGLWLNGIESVTHDRVTADWEDYIALPFEARSVNVVLNPPGVSFDVRVELDGRPLTAGEAGADIEFDSEGHSFFRAYEGRLYGLVELPATGRHELKLSSNSDAFAVFAFTFGVYADVP
ncbi:MAG: hypothetical protein QF664_12610 [Dehalococcoidia bacterium]|nr:hypothetical protein [Dehalococcoidia bacterium]